MAKATYVTNVTLFDGRAAKANRGVLFGGEGIAWVGAHARAQRAAREALRAATENGADLRRDGRRV